MLPHPDRGRGPRRATAGVPLAAIALSTLVLVVAACGSDQDPAIGGGATSSSTTATSAGASSTDGETTTTTAAAGATVIEVTVSGGRPEGGVRTESVELGEQVELRVTSDEADEIHVHGYDLYADLAPGEPTALTFTADIPGQFEVELHGTGTALLTLQVRG